MSKYIDRVYDRVYTIIKNTCSCMPTMKGEIIPMTENEKELISLIHENDKPEQALMTATLIILGFLKQHESSVVQVSVDLQELC